MNGRDNPTIFSTSQPDVNVGPTTAFGGNALNGHGGHGHAATHKLPPMPLLARSENRKDSRPNLSL